MTDLGTVRRNGGFGAVHFTRHYRVPPEELWSAWTEPERIARWLGAAVEGGPVVTGGSFALVWAEGADNRVDLVVRSLEPPSRLEWEWTITGEPPTTLTVTLVPAGDGTDLVLDHAKLPLGQYAGLGAGWDAYLSSLAAHLGGTAHDWDGRFMAVLPAYQSQVAALG